jgi:DnaJ-domain-containing protein 1
MSRIAKKLRVAALRQASAVDADDAAQVSYRDRFEAMEDLRRLYFRYDDNSRRLERVLVRASLAEHKVSSDWRARPRLSRRGANH